MDAEDTSLCTNRSTDQSHAHPGLLLATKLYTPPTRQNLVARPRLLERLSQAVNCRLILVSAPAGFGKTTLLSEWIERQPPNWAFCWLTLDTTDNDPSRFCRYLIAALQKWQLALGQALLPELYSPQPPPLESLLTVLLNDLGQLVQSSEWAARHGVVILDDYYQIESSIIHAAVSFLIDHLPPQVHLVIATRADPLFPLARWRSRREMLEVRVDDLRFTDDEAACFLHQRMALDLAPADVAVLKERTEGWIAGLQMAALSLQNRGDLTAFVQAFSGSHRHILDYLSDEVLNRQPAAVQRFLLYTSVLERMSAPLCDTLIQNCPPVVQPDVLAGASGTCPAQSMLEHLERTNLFVVPLDDERRWYRYHHLFADLLRIRLGQAQPEIVPVLHRCASTWHEQNEHWEEAIHHALQSGDEERAAGLIERVLLTQQHMARLRGLSIWIEQLPGSLINRRPLLCLLRAMDLTDRSQLDEVDELLRTAEEGILSTDTNKDILGVVYTTRSLAASLRGDLSQIVESSQHAQDELALGNPWLVLAHLNLGNAYFFQGELAEVDRVWSHALEIARTMDDFYLMTRTMVAQSRLKQQQGRLSDAAATYERALRLVKAHPGASAQSSGLLKIGYGDLLCERGDLPAARQWVEEGLPEVESEGTPSDLAWGCVHLATILLASGDSIGADQVAEKAQHLVQTHTLYPDVIALTRLFRARWHQARGDLAAAWHALEGRAAQRRWKHLLLKEWLLIAQAGLLIAQDSPEEAESLLAEVQTPALAGGRGQNLIEILLLLALARHTQGQTDAAYQSMAECLALAEPEGYVRLFVNRGPVLTALLEQGLAEGMWAEHRLADYTRRLLAACSCSIQEPEHPARQAFSPPGEPLSARECEVLRLVVTGLSNQEIASELYLTQGTVKTHVHHIYGKLGARNRAQAIARARELDLL